MKNSLKSLSFLVMFLFSSIIFAASTSIQKVYPDEFVKDIKGAVKKYSGQRIQITLHLFYVDDDYSDDIIKITGTNIDPENDVFSPATGKQRKVLEFEFSLKKSKAKSIKNFPSSGGWVGKGILLTLSGIIENYVENLNVSFINGEFLSLKSISENPIKSTSKEITKAFNENFDQASEKYENQIIEVNGNVVDITKKESGWYLIKLKSIGSYNFVIIPKFYQDNELYKKGDLVSTKGKLLREDNLLIIKFSDIKILKTKKQIKNKYIK